MDYHPSICRSLGLETKKRLERCVHAHRRQDQEKTERQRELPQNVEPILMLEADEDNNLDTITEGNIRQVNFANRRLTMMINKERRTRRRCTNGRRRDNTTHRHDANKIEGDIRRMASTTFDDSMLLPPNGCCGERVSPPDVMKAVTLIATSLLAPSPEEFLSTIGEFDRVAVREVKRAIDRLNTAMKILNRRQQEQREERNIETQQTEAAATATVEVEEEEETEEQEEEIEQQEEENEELEEEMEDEEEDETSSKEWMELQGKTSTCHRHQHDIVRESADMATAALSVEDTGTSNSSSRERVSLPDIAIALKLFSASLLAPSPDDFISSLSNGEYDRTAVRELERAIKMLNIAQTIDKTRKEDQSDTETATEMEYNHKTFSPASDVDCSSARLQSHDDIATTPSYTIGLYDTSPSSGRSGDTSMTDELSNIDTTTSVHQNPLPTTMLAPQYITSPKTARTTTRHAVAMAEMSSHVCPPHLLRRRPRRRAAKRRYVEERTGWSSGACLSSLDDTDVSTYDPRKEIDLGSGSDVVDIDSLRWWI